MIREAGQWKRGYLKLKIWAMAWNVFLNVCGKTGIEIWGVRAERTSCDPVCFCCMETEGYPQDPPGCPENQSPHPDYRSGWACHFSFTGTGNDGFYLRAPS